MVGSLVLSFRLLKSLQLTSLLHKQNVRVYDNYYENNNIRETTSF